jgi:hypothetical protein
LPPQTPRSTPWRRRSALPSPHMVPHQASSYWACRGMEELSHAMAQVVRHTQERPQRLSAITTPKCSFSGSPAYGNCACAEKNFKKKGLDLLAAVVGKGCTSGYDAKSASPWWDCPSGSNLPGMPRGVRQQGWYENPQSIAAKVGLASKWQLGGVGVWSLTGCSGMTPDSKAIRNVFAEYLSH